MRVSSTCLVVLDRNRYSVPAEFAGRVVSARTMATQVSMTPAPVLARRTAQSPVASCSKRMPLSASNMMAQNISGSTFDLAAVTLSARVVKRRAA